MAAGSRSLNFYPRPPRGGRPYRPVPAAPPLRISIHALREEGDRFTDKVVSNLVISIHALREEGDRASVPGRPIDGRFLSTPSARRATAHIRDTRARNRISIHALREEGDAVQHRQAAAPHYFYPRPPRGGRPPDCWEAQSDETFLSTPSARRATFSCPPVRRGPCDFYPRPPRGGRRGGRLL